MGRLSAELSEEAHDAWRDFAASNGVTVTGLLEALGSLKLSRVLPSGVVDAARRIDSERRERG